MFRSVLITGASRGLGRALALGLAEPGTKLALVARGAEALDATAAVCRDQGAEVMTQILDVSQGDETVTAVRDLDARLGGLDLVVANAGVGPELEAPPYSWEALAGPCHVNFCGAVATLTAALPAMVARGRGHLVGVSSLSSFGALPGSAAYCGPKAGLSMVLECLRLDVAPHGVAVTNIYAGFIDTDMVEHRRESMPQLMSPEDAAQRILRALPNRPARIDFPQPLALAARAGARLPRPLRDRLVRRLVDG